MWSGSLFNLHPEVIGSLLGRCNLQWKFAVCPKDQAQVSRLHIVGCVNLSYCRVCQISHRVAFRLEALIESPLALRTSQVLGVKVCQRKGNLGNVAAEDTVSEIDRIFDIGG